jgi:hypothetical protein
MDVYPIYGGPMAGKETEEAGAMYTARSRPGDDTMFVYELYAVIGGKAFMPRDDADLLAAYQDAEGESGNPEADALAGEIKRRGLNN